MPVYRMSNQRNWKDKGYSLYRLWNSGYTSFRRSPHNTEVLSTDWLRPLYQFVLASYAVSEPVPMFPYQQWLHGYSQKSAIPFWGSSREFCPYKIVYGNGSLPGDTVYLYRFNEETLQFEKGDSAMLDDRQQVCFTGKYTGPEFVCGGVRKKATSKFFMLDSTEVFAYNVLLHEEPNFFNPSGYK